ncbi:hypothetical protein UFOVP326_90 [uncultured Caudovirales phage]|uniref:Uncharacterized protein n=1 Tax=uncultured Caudovirales phage TaxID=2100421 RepID=A0A6J5M1D8_9CAUD|nr:hypothetical protein UFOVP326_90 [uncultured Caudovirales phage]
MERRRWPWFVLGMVFADIIITAWPAPEVRVHGLPPAQAWCMEVHLRMSYAMDWDTLMRHAGMMARALHDAEQACLRPEERRGTL